MRERIKFHSKRLTLFFIQLAFLAGSLLHRRSGFGPFARRGSCEHLQHGYSALAAYLRHDRREQNRTRFELPAEIHARVLHSRGRHDSAMPPHDRRPHRLVALVCIITTVLVFLSTALTVILVGRLQKYIAGKRAGKDVHLRGVFTTETEGE